MSPITGAGAEPSSSAARPQQLMLPACPEHSHPGHPRRPLDALPPSQCPEAALLLALETYRRPARPLLSPELQWRVPPARAPETAGRDVGKNARMAHAIWLAYCAEARGSAHGPKELLGRRTRPPSGSWPVKGCASSGPRSVHGPRPVGISSGPARAWREPRSAARQMLLTTDDRSVFGFWKRDNAPRTIDANSGWLAPSVGSADREEGSR